MTRRRRVVGTLMGVVLLLVGGCATGPGSIPGAPDVPDAANAPQVGPAQDGLAMVLPGDFSDTGPGSLVSATTTATIDRRVRAATATSARIVYRSTSGVDGGPTEVTGAVFAPRGSAPEGGWPVIALGHGSTGILTECAPSLTPDLMGAALSVAALTSAGFLVVMPDYQGLGSDGAVHPYLDPWTAGRNIIDGVRAVGRLQLDASDRYLTWGTSQGGQAVWAANELQTDYGQGLDLVGAVAISPVTDLIPLAEAAEDATLTRDQIPALQWLLASLNRVDPAFDVDAYRSGVAAEEWNLLTQCRGPVTAQRAEAIERVEPGDLSPQTAEAAQDLRRHLSRMSLPAQQTAAPMLVLYGDADELVLPEWTAAALASACELGDVLDIRLLPGLGHGEYDTGAALTWALGRFEGQPVADSCQPPPEAPPVAPADGEPEPAAQDAP